MSSMEVHVVESILKARINYPELFKKHTSTLIKLINELHKWFDHFHGKKGETFDYTGINCMKHRERRHHIEGIGRAGELFSKKYGLEFAKVIRAEAERHIFDDMGVILSAQDFRSIGFWKKIRGF